MLHLANHMAFKPRRAGPRFPGVKPRGETGARRPGLLRAGAAREVSGHDHCRDCLSVILPPVRDAAGIFRRLGMGVSMAAFRRHRNPVDPGARLGRVLFYFCFSLFFFFFCGSWVCPMRAGAGGADHSDPRSSDRPRIIAGPLPHLCCFWGVWILGGGGSPCAPRDSLSAENSERCFGFRRKVRLHARKHIGDLVGLLYGGDDLLGLQMAARSRRLSGLQRAYLGERCSPRVRRNIFVWHVAGLRDQKRVHLVCPIVRSAFVTSGELWFGLRKKVAGAAKYRHLGPSLRPCPFSLHGIQPRPKGKLSHF